MTFDLPLSESAGLRSLDRRVRSLARSLPLATRLAGLEGTSRWRIRARLFMPSP